MIDYAKLETSIAAMLSPLASIAEIVVLPENQTGVNGLPMPVQKPRIVVAYRDSEYKDLSLSSGHAQEELVFFNVEIAGKGLRTASKGVHILVQAVKGLLMGKVPTDPITPFKKLSNAIAFRSSGYAEQPYNESIWTYIIVGFVTTMAIQTTEAETEELIHQFQLVTDPDETGTIADTYNIPTDLNSI